MYVDVTRQSFADAMSNDNELFEDAVILSLADKFIQEKLMYIINRTDDLKLPDFLIIIWPIELNEAGVKGKIYISNIDPKLVNVYNVTVKKYPSDGPDDIYVEIQSSDSVFSDLYGPNFYIIRQKIGSEYQLILAPSPLPSPPPPSPPPDPDQPSIFRYSLVPDEDTLYSPQMIKSLQVQQGVLSKYLLDNFFRFNEEQAAAFTGVAVEAEAGLSVEEIDGGTNKTYIGGNSEYGTETAMKANLAYIICMAMSSHRYAWDKVFEKRVSSWQPATKLAIIEAIKQERLLLDKILKKAENPGSSPGSTGAGDIDKKLKDNLLTKLSKTSYKNADFFEETRKPLTGMNTFLSDIDKKDQGSKYVNLFANLKDKNKKYYLSNAVPATEYLTNSTDFSFSVTPHFCETSSIMDGQSTCSTIDSAEKGDGAYIGDQVFTITDAASLGGGAPSGTAITYNLYIKVNRDSTPPNTSLKRCTIYAHYQCGDTTLVDIGPPNNDAMPQNWPNPSSSYPRAEGLDVNLNNANMSPLNAVNCFYALCNVAITLYKDKRMGFNDILKELKSNKDWANERRNVLNVSVRKSLGDVLQELSAVSDNGGYLPSPAPKIYPPKNGGSDLIAEPKEGRLMLSNDGPSGLRSVLYVLYGIKGINPNILAGYLHPGASVSPGGPNPCKPATSCSDFFVAGRIEDKTVITPAEKALSGGGKYSKTNKKKKKKNTQKRKSKKDKKKNKKTKKKFFLNYF